ncbi:hypothetical protein KAJ27_07930 [bacterium]|nr:hypothetical protein [bacterium]
MKFRISRAIIIILILFVGISCNIWCERIGLTTFLYNTFEFNDAVDKNVERVWLACEIELKKKGYEVVPYDEVIAAFKSLKIGGYKLSTREVERMCREIGVDKVITGRIHKYLGYKGFSISDFFSTEGEIVLESRMYSISKQSWSWKNRVKARKKYRLSGIFKKKGLLLRSLLKDAATKLFRTFSKQDTEQLKKDLRE